MSTRGISTLFRIHAATITAIRNIPFINVQPRMVEHYEVDFFTKGKGMLVINGKPIEFEEGSVNFRKPGQVN